MLKYMGSPRETKMGWNRRNEGRKNESGSMKILIMGAGAVGGYFGALLQRAGQDIHYIARGDHLMAMKENGLRIEGVTLNETFEVKASEDPNAFSVMDLIIICVKSQDTRAALVLIEPSVTEDTMILTLQNGVENEDLIASRYGIERTIGGVAYIGVGVEAPGVIRNQTPGRIAVGRLVQEGVPQEDMQEKEEVGNGKLIEEDQGKLWEGGRYEDRFNDVVQVFREAGIDCSVTKDIMMRKWGKLVWNATFNPISVLTGRSSHNLKGDMRMRELLHGIIHEVIAVAGSEGYELEFERIVEKMFDMDRAVQGTKTSMLQDFEKGKPLEIEELNGAVVRIGRRNGIPTPINTTIVGLVRGKVIR